MSAPPSPHHLKEASSPYAPSPGTSPLHSAPSSPVVELQSSPILSSQHCSSSSSPLQAHQLSRSSSSSSCEDQNSVPKRSKYEFFDPAAPGVSNYWPASTSRQGDNLIFMKEVPLDHDGTMGCADNVHQQQDDRCTSPTVPTDIDYENDDTPDKFQNTLGKYEFFDPAAPGVSNYWPASTSRQGDNLIFMKEVPLDHDGTMGCADNVHQQQDDRCTSPTVPTDIDYENDDTPDKFQNTLDRVYGSKALSSTDSSEDDIVFSDSSSAGSAGSEYSSQAEEDTQSVHSNGDDISVISSEEEPHADSDDESSLISETVYQGSSLTVDEGVLTLMDLFVKYKIPKSGMGGILQSTLKFLPTNHKMPKSSHLLFQYVEKQCSMSKETVHFYCSACLYYLGLHERQCPICNNNVCHNFYQLSLCDQIRNLFENHGLADIIDNYRIQKQANPNRGKYICDLEDGLEFKRAYVDGQYNLTLLGHTDGISVSESSNVSLWPIEYVISQVPPNLRFKYVLVSGVWLDESKPNMNSFFKPFVPELVDLSVKGVVWIHPTTRVSNVSVVTCPSFSVDAPVRAGLQNILSHGGKYSCNICEQKTKRLPQEPVLPGVKKKPRKRVFQFQETASTLRTSDRMETQGKESRKKQREGGKLVAQKGVKGPCVISGLPGCDRSTVVFPEYMHLILVLTKHFFNLWFKEEGPWSLKHKRDTIDAFLSSIRVPDFLTRIPRSTEHYCKWKANELRSFLLYFSLIILKKCMKHEYFEHWMLFVNGLYLLLQDEISEKCVMIADISLKMFCRDFSKLYRPQYYTYYIHNVLHLSLTVLRHGNLWSNSAFQFENFNGTLAKYIHGTKNQGKELVNNVKLAIGVEALKARVFLSKPPTTVGCQSLVNFKNEVKIVQFAEEANLLLSSRNMTVPIRVYSRAVISKEVFTTAVYSRQKKRNNFTICYLDETRSSEEYGEIIYFCESASNEQVAIVKMFRVELNRLFTHTASGLTVNHVIPIKETDIIIIIRLDQIIRKVIKVEDFVCLRPNIVEVNL